MSTSFHSQAHQTLKDMSREFFTLDISLGFRIYFSAFLIVFTTCFTYFLINSFLRKQALTSNEILDTRVASMDAAQKIKESVVAYDNVIFRFVATKSNYDLERAQDLRKTALLELERLNTLSSNRIIKSRLGVLRSRLRAYFLEANNLVEFARSNNLPATAGLFEAASWARSQGTQRIELSVLSAEGGARLESVFSLCEELLTFNRAQLWRAQDELNSAFDESQRLGKNIVAVAVGIVLLVAIGLAISLLGPLRHLMLGVKKIEAGNFDVQVPVTSSTEIGKLTTAFNRMALTIREQQERLLQEAITDNLTGAFNQRHFSQRLEQEFERTKRTEEPLSLMMIDVDHFKSYNDSMGHEIGNVVLKKIAMAIKDSLRNGDLLFRYGGDEFAVILPNADPKEANVIAARLTDAIRYAHFPGTDTGTVKQVTLSIGGASIPSNALSVNDLVAKADQALYESKDAGRNCFNWARAVIEPAQG